MSRAVIEELMDGSQFDRIQAYYRFGEIKIELSAADEEYLKQLERIKEIWLAENDEVTTRNKTIEEFKCSMRTAYNLIADAKKIWALTARFDYGFELMIQKRWIDKAFRQAESLGDGKLYKAAFDANSEWMRRMVEYQAVNNSDEPKQLTIIHTDDYTKLGVSHEEMAEWELIIETDLLPKAKQKFKVKAIDIPYEDVR